ncbi:MAG: hypothetical protein ACK55I_50390, partial [bacterium]
MNAKVIPTGVDEFVFITIELKSLAGRNISVCAARANPTPPVADVKEPDVIPSMLITASAVDVPIFLIWTPSLKEKAEPFVVVPVVKYFHPACMLSAVKPIVLVVI